MRPKDRLKLTPQQVERAGELHAAVEAERPKSTRLLEAERRLARLFAERTATEDNVRAAVAEIERARTEVAAAPLSRVVVGPALRARRARSGVDGR